MDLGDLVTVGPALADLGYVSVPERLPRGRMYGHGHGHGYGHPAPGPPPHQTYAVLGDGPLDELAA
ncbi:hypothetical protein [Streptomyces sp. NPDC094049]|uniref:hypothetical protein n=1 Tax=Streptomyces sp. NPDC094049 TaxID=3154987 RepID=UPI0033302C60